MLWSFLADLFTRSQAKRLFGFVGAGVTIGGIAGPALATLLAEKIGNNNLMLMAAVGFFFTAVLCTGWRARSSVW